MYLLIETIFEFILHRILLIIHKTIKKQFLID